MSMRQQLAIIKQMDQPSPSGSQDGDYNASSSSSTPRRNIPRVHKKNNRGETPLHGFAKKGDANKCYDLICEGADVNCKDYAGWTPLHEACSHHGYEAARVLIAHGALVNVASDDGDTPLHDAAESSNLQITWLLLKHGANREARNKDNFRPVDLTDDEKVLELLQAESVPEECPSEDGTTTTAVDEKKGIDLPQSSMASGSSEDVAGVSSLPPMAPELSTLTIDTAMDVFTAPLDSAPMQSAGRSILSVAAQNPSESPMQSGGGGLDLSDESESLDSAESIENNTGNTSPQISPHLRVDHLSPSPERRGKSSEPELQKRTAVWRTDRSASHSRAVSPHHPYDFVEDPEDSREEVRSESGFGKKRGGRAGRGRGGRASSGTATPLVKKAARGARGGRRGGRASAARVLDMTETAAGTSEDVYDFRGTPDSEIDERMIDEREASVGPSSKRFRPNDDADSVTGTADLDDEPEEDEASRSSTKKVPILRISLAGAAAKQPSEEDEATPYRSKHLGRGRPGGKKGSEQDEDKRITRSKVRQSGRGLGDDGDSWPKKKRRAQTVDPQMDADDQMEESALLRPVVPEEPEYVPNLESMSDGQKILYEKPHKGILSMRKLMMSRWHKDLATDKTNANLETESNKQTETLQPVKLEAVTPGEVPHCLAGDPEGSELWRRQEADRVEKLKEFNVRRVRLRLCYNEEFKRMEQRREGIAPRMSAIRVFREDQICNPMLFDEPIVPPKPLPREEFDERVRKGVKKLYREEVMDTEAIRGLQRGEWQSLWRRRGFAGSDALLAMLVPTLPSEELIITFPSSTTSS